MCKSARRPIVPSRATVRCCSQTLRPHFLRPNVAMITFCLCLSVPVPLSHCLSRALSLSVVIVLRRTGPSQLSANATAGVAEMRRDGFASVAASISTSGASMVTPAAQLISRPLQWSAASNKTTLFVNVGGADASNMKFSFVDGNNQPLAGLAGGTIAAEGERVAVKFQTAGAISAAAALPVRLRVVFPLLPGGGGNDGGGGARLYAFWLASSQCGASNGWVAAGGPGLNATRDFNGNC